jgi:transcription-repair coupling factor (superfamily II helicase)
MAILHGLEAVSTGDLSQAEMVRLEFADDSKVLVPLGELRSIWRYSSDPTSVTLDKADGSSWEGRRAALERDIRETATHLSKLATERRARKAVKIVPPVAEYERFVARFPYFATPDQSKAVEDVLADLAAGSPMDRLVCGDVGYGKTEVALRAAAAAIFAGRQVAIAVPTTVLARQHLEAFRRRFAPFGIEVGELSRFISPAEARAVKKRLADGTLKLVIGTHALAAKGVRFNDLGLLVIDEEQRFGLADKAKLARLRDGVHLLTMTATPIPRTLSEAYAGIRPISGIATPPARRVPIKTVIEFFDEITVATALRREQRRRGQSFVVCPRIEDIGPMRDRLETIVPELRITTLHGQMPPRDIDEVMLDFASGSANVLLTTNIIESGLDIPRANTIIVWRPDKFGLAQLHQLRGRVGRGNARAFALFLTDPEAKLSRTAANRLEILGETVHPGAGLDISYSDMDLRGGGDLLSERQSGHVKLVGPALFRHLLERAMSDAGHLPFGYARPQLNLGISAFLPTSYIKDEATRLEAYARISKCESEDELDDIEDAMIERFGELSDQAVAYLELARLLIACLHLGITSVTAGPDSVAVTLEGTRAHRKSKTIANKGLRWKGDRLIYDRSSNTSERLRVVRELIDLLEDSGIVEAA